jgi:hypothetical protein
MSKVCQKLDNFCYICGLYILSWNIKIHLKSVKQTYLEYFGHPIESNSHSPSFSCLSCYYGLRCWFRGTNKTFILETPMVWAPPSDGHKDCYACLTAFYPIIDGIRQIHPLPRPHWTLVYPKNSTSRRPVVNSRSRSRRKKLFV